MFIIWEVFVQNSKKKNFPWTRPIKNVNANIE